MGISAGDSSRSREASEESNAELTEGDATMAGDDTDTGSVNAMTFVHPAGTSTLPVGAVDQQPGNNQNVFAHPANISGAGRSARRPSLMQVDMAVTDGEDSQASTCKFEGCIAVSMFRLI